MNFLIMAHACFLLRYDASTCGVALSILRYGACVRARSGSAAAPAR
jgi:hypothetical protein